MRRTIVTSLSDFELVNTIKGVRSLHLKCLGRFRFLRAKVQDFSRDCVNTVGTI